MTMLMHRAYICWRGTRLVDTERSVAHLPGRICPGCARNLTLRVHVRPERRSAVCFSLRYKCRPPSHPVVVPGALLVRAG